MQEDQEELTPEQYKVRVLRSRFAERVTEYEDIIAELLTTRAQLEQRVQELEEQLGETDVVEEDDA